MIMQQYIMSPLQGFYLFNIIIIGLTAYAIKYHPSGVYYSYDGILLEYYPSPARAELQSVVREGYEKCKHKHYPSPGRAK